MSEATKQRGWKSAFDECPDCLGRGYIYWGTGKGVGLDKHVTEFHNLGNDLEEWCEIRVRKDLIPKGATLIEAYITSSNEIVVMGQPKKDDENHNCDAMGCGSLSHVLHRLPLQNIQTEP